MKNIIKKGDMKLTKFKCDFCGTEWESDDFIVDNMRATTDKYIKDDCPVCKKFNEQKI